MELNLFLIDNIEDHEEAYVKFKTGKRCWTWDDQVEAIVTMTEGFDLYLDDMTEEERNDMDEIDIAKTRFALNQMENWRYFYEDCRDERKAFSRWLQIEQHGAFTIEQVAEATGKSPATIRNKIKKLGIKKPNQNGNKFGKWEFCKDEFEHLVLLIKAQ